MSVFLFGGILLGPDFQNRDFPSCQVGVHCAQDGLAEAASVMRRHGFATRRSNKKIPFVYQQFSCFRFIFRKRPYSLKMFEESYFWAPGQCKEDLHLILCVLLQDWWSMALDTLFAKVLVKLPQCTLTSGKQEGSPGAIFCIWIVTQISMAESVYSLLQNILVLLVYIYSTCTVYIIQWYSDTVSNSNSNIF